MVPLITFPERRTNYAFIAKSPTFNTWYDLLLHGYKDKLKEITSTVSSIHFQELKELPFGERKTPYSSGLLAYAVSNNFNFSQMSHDFYLLSNALHSLQFLYAASYFHAGMDGLYSDVEESPERILIGDLLYSRANTSLQGIPETPLRKSLFKILQGVTRAQLDLRQLHLDRQEHCVDELLEHACSYQVALQKQNNLLILAPFLVGSFYGGLSSERIQQFRYFGQQLASFFILNQDRNFFYIFSQIFPQQTSDKKFRYFSKLPDTRISLETLGHKNISLDELLHLQEIFSSLSPSENDIQDVLLLFSRYGVPEVETMITAMRHRLHHLIQKITPESRSQKCLETLLEDYSKISSSAF